MTVRELLSSSLRKIGALASGETADASEINDALVAFNGMISSWSNEGLIIPSKVRETFTLSGSQSSYAMGSGATFDTTRPIRIETALLTPASDATLELPIVILNKDDFAGIPVKSTESNIPLYMYVEYSWPNLTIKLYPVPADASTLVLYSWKPLTTYSNLSTTLTVQNGLEEAMIYNLAIRLAPEYGKEPSGAVVQIAAESLANIKRVNLDPGLLRCDAAILNRNNSYNILTGGYE